MVKKEFQWKKNNPCIHSLFHPREYKYTAGFGFALTEWWSLKVWQPWAGCVCKVAQHGGFHRSRHPAKGAHPSQPRPEATSAPFPHPRPNLRNEATWCCLESQDEEENLAQTDQKSPMLLSPSHCFLYVLGQSSGHMISSISSQNQRRLILCIFSFWHFVLASQCTNVHGRWGIPPSPRSRWVCRVHVQAMMETVVFLF